MFFLKSTGKRGKFWHIINDIRENVADSMEWVFLFPEFVEKVEVADGNKFEIHRADDAAFEIDAPWLLDILYTSDIDDYSSLQYFQRRLQASGIIDKLKEMGVKEGDTIRIDDFEFDYVD